MLKNERFTRIVALLDEVGTVTTKEISEKLNISEATVRRDIKELDKIGKLNKVFGGAASIESTRYISEDIDIGNRYFMNTEAKEIIGKHASDFIESGDFVYLDAGTTVDAMVKHLDPMKKVNYVTDSLEIAQKISARGLNVHIVPGTVKAKTNSVIGALTLNALAKFNFSKGFFGTNGISLKSSFSTPDVEEAEVKAMAMSRCRDIYVLSDISKFDKISGVTFANLNSEITVVTSASSNEERKKLERYNKKLKIISIKGGNK